MQRTQRPSGDHARGDRTRLQLLDAATEIFASNNYDSVRTRMLSDAAGVNQAAIPYYFGGKEGLYLAVAQRIAEALEEQTRALRRQADDALRRNPPAPRAEILRTLHRVLSGFARSSLEEPGRAARTAFIVREQLHPTKAFDLIYGHAMEPLHRAVGALIARLDEQPEDDPRCILHAHALLSQVIGFATGRTALLRRLGQTRLSPKQIGQIADLAGTLATAPFAATPSTAPAPPPAVANS